MLLGGSFLVVAAAGFSPSSRHDWRFTTCATNLLRAPPIALASSAAAAPPPPPAQSGSVNSDAVRLLIPELRGNAMSRIIAAAGEKTSIEALRAAVERFETVGLPRSKLAELLSKRPSAIKQLLTRGDAVEALLVKLAALGVNDVSDIVIAQPKILTLNERRLVEATAFLEAYVGRDRVSDFVQLHPQSLLWRDEEALPVAQHLRALGISKRAIEKARSTLPTIDRISSAANVERTLEYLCDELGLKTSGLSALVASYPQVLGLSFEHNVKPTVEYVRSLGVSPRKAFVRHPSLLGLSLDANLR